MARSPLLTGAQVLCYINSRAFGRVADLGWTSDTPLEELRVVDVLEPVELIPQGVSVRGQLSIYRLRQDGGLQAAGMVATWADLTRQKYFSILVVDRVTDTVIFRADKCMVGSESWRFGKGYVMGQVSFQGLGWSNETEPSQD
jgi:hypothetical protein